MSTHAPLRKPRGAFFLSVARGLHLSGTRAFGIPRRGGNEHLSLPCETRLGSVSLLILLGLASSAPVAGKPSRSGDETPHGSLDAPCASCHSEVSWNELRSPLEFDHSSSGFELLFSHDELKCESCHESLVFSKVETACADCHQDPHSDSLGHRCETCHAPRGWDSRRKIFDLHSATLFPLTGAHAAADCFSCHREEPALEFGTAPTGCFSCHRADYQSAARPDHARIGFPTNCATCHITSTWHEARVDFGPDFDHDLFYPLTGAHRGRPCESCHAAGYSGTPTDCFSCHRTEYDSTTDPNHLEAGFPTTCEACHGTDRWQGATFDHDQFFALTGAHRKTSCESCHVDEQYAGTPTDCYSCHRADYDDTDAPPHPSAGFPTTCESCHGTDRWEGAAFDHDQFFGLTGAHRQASCESCHADGVYAGTPRDCYSCHANDYNRTNDPNHRAAGFPTGCETCHDAQGWDNATFDHGQYFPLEGAHAQTPCESCHANGFASTPSDCFSCHANEYNATTDPNHQAAGFPTTCESCHDTSDWDNATFDHEAFFPIKQGPHRGIACNECHVVPNNFQEFECIECHEHRKSEMDDEHDDVSGYIWDSQYCYSCHPNGRE